MSGELISAEEAGRVLNPTRPLSAAAARKTLYRADIGEVRGYPADEVRGLAEQRAARRGNTTPDEEE